MAGAGYKLFNTGDVLTAAQVNTYLQEQTVMVFADATARTTALSGVLAEGMVTYLKDTDALEIYSGSAWVGYGSGDITGVTAGTGISGGGTSGAVTITNSMATEITAAGDIIVGTGSGTFDNLPIGTTGQILTADTTVSPYKVKWASASSSSPLTTKGDLYTYSTTNDRLPVGTNDYVLIAASGETTGLKWGGTWTTWTPTYNDLTVGNGTVTARYLKLGKTVFFDFKIIFGSTTSITGGAPSFNLPSTSKSAVFFFDGNILDNGIANYGASGQVTANTTRVYWKIYDVTSTYPVPGNVSSTIPMTWGTNDEYQLHGFYEEA